MTLRLSAFFETHIKTVLSNWKASMRRAEKNRRNARTSSSVSPTKRRNQRSRRKAAKKRRRLNSSEDEEVESEASMRLGGDDDEDDDDDDDDDNPRPSGSQSMRRNGHLKRGARAITASQNRVTSSSSTQPNTYAIAEHDNMRARRSKRQKTDVNNSSDSEEEEEEDEDDEELEDEDDSDDSSGSDTKSSASEIEKKSARRAAQRNNRRNNVLDEDEEDSEESYKPTRAYKNKTQRLNKQTHRRHKDDYVEPSGTRASPAKRKTPAKAQLTNGSVPQQDESTQEAETPLKGTRASKTTNTATISYDDGPSTSASALLRMRQEQRVADPNRSRTRNRHLVVDTNDHSYHLPVRNGRLVDSDSDSHEAVVRPTRASVKRAIQNWGRTSDVEAADEEQRDLPRNNNASETEEILPTPTKVNGTTSRSRQASNVLRPAKIAE